MSDRELIRRVAARYLIARDFFEIGDPILFGKYKNKKGVIVGWGKDHKGNPTVFIDPIPKGRKKTKEMGLFKFWHNPPPLIKKQQEEAEAEAAQIKLGCIAGAGALDGHNFLLKVRDRNYVPAVRIIRELVDGVEIAYLHDLDTDWSEGMNEYGIGVISSALMVIEDESVKKEKTFAPDGRKIRNILSKTTLGGATDEAVSNGVTGHTFIGSGSEIVTIEMDGDNSEIRVLDTSEGKVAVRTNHGEDIEAAGYTDGPDFKSSKSRKEQAERSLHRTKSVDDIALGLTKSRLKNRENPNNLIRDTEKMMSTSLAVLDLETCTMKTYLVPQKVDFCGIENRLPEGYKQKIKLEFFEFQKWDTDHPKLRQLDNKDLGTLKIFAYGSMMLDPVMPEAILTSQKATLTGYQRAFNRFSRGRDHLVVGTNPEGKMEGVLLEYPMNIARTVLRRIDVREGFKLDRDKEINSYTRVPVYVDTKEHPDGVRAISYHTNPDGPGYKGKLALDTLARRLAEGKGYEYLRDLAQALQKWKCSDPYIEDLMERIEQRKDPGKTARRVADRYLALQIRVAARYKSKKKVKKQDGGDMTVYEYSDRQIADRNRGKAKRIEGLRKSVNKLRTQVKKDLKGSDDKTRAVALAVALMDHTFERVGNDGSAKEGHFGVTTWTLDHVSFKGNKATIKYVGKSGVDQKKEVTDGAIVKALKAACKDKGKDACLVDAKASDVNSYLKPFDISAKDIRGFHANTEMKAQLKKVRKGKLPADPKERAKKLKEEFKAALEATAGAVGHEPSTLKSQYLVPGLEDDYMKDGVVNESHTKKGGRDEKDESQREDEQAQQMVRKAPKLKPPRYDLRNNRTLKERDKDMEGLDKQDGGDDDLQKDVRRQARRVAFKWLALPREPSAQRLLMRMAAAKPDAATSQKGKAHRSNDPDNPGWIGMSPTGAPHFFEEGEFAEDKAKAYAKGTKFEPPKKPKKKKKKDEPAGEEKPGTEEDVPTEEPTDEEVADGETDDEEEAQAGKDTENELGQVTEERDAQQQVVDGLMTDLETVEAEEKDALEESIIDEKSKLKKLKDKVEEIEKAAEEPAEEPAEEAPKKEEPKKKQTPEELEDFAEEEVNRITKILEDNKDETGDLNDFEKKKYERELGEARETLGAMHASSAENDRTEKRVQELYEAEKEKGSKGGKTPKDFQAQAREEVVKEMTTERRQKNIGEANKIVTDLIGPGSTLPEDTQEAMTKVLGGMSDKQAAEFATSFKEQMAALVETPGDSASAQSLANRAATFKKFDGIKDPKELAKRAAEAAYAKNVVANPKILGGVPLSDTPKDAAQMAARITESVEHYRGLDPSLRKGAAKDLVGELESLDPKSNRAKEANAILTGIATAAVLDPNLTDEDAQVPGRPAPSSKARKLLQTMDKQGNLAQVFTPVSDLTSPASRIALGDAMRDMKDEDLTEQVTDGDKDHPLGPLSELLNDDDLDPDIKAAIREALIGITLDDMTWGDAAIREMTGEKDPKKRLALAEKTQGSKEQRGRMKDLADAVKNGETDGIWFTNSEEGESGVSNDEGVSLLDVMRDAQVSNLLEQHSEGADAVPGAPSVAVLREYANSKDPSVLETEVSPSPNEFRSDSKGKKSGSKSHLSVYRKAHMSEGPSDDSVQSLAPTIRRQTSMPKITENGARQVTANLDRLADLFQSEFKTLGVPPDVASDMALRCDMLSDRIETHAGLRPRQAQMDPPANYTEEKVAPNEFNPAEIGEESSQAFLRNEDEPYMDAFTQDENDQLRQVQQDGMFSNAKAASELIRKLQARLAAGDSAQKKTELSDELARLAASLDDFADLDDKVAKFHEAVDYGGWTEGQLDEAARQFRDLADQADETAAEIEAAVGAVLRKKEKVIEKEQKKLLAEIKKHLPETLRGQGKVLLELRSHMIKYAKAAERKRPGVKQMMGDPNNDLGADISERGGELLQRYEEKLGKVIAAQAAAIYDTVMEELTVAKPVLRGLEIELKEKTASGDKQAGFMTTILKFREWLSKKWSSVKRLFDMGDKRIDNAAKLIKKQMDETDKAYDKALKSASDKSAGKLPAHLEKFKKEKGGGTKGDSDDGDDKKDDEKSDDKKDDDKDSGKPWEKDKKASHGFDLTA